MKICIIISDITKVGGIERVTSTLLDELTPQLDLNFEILSLFKGRETPAYPIPDNVKIYYLTNEAHGVKPHSWKRAFKMFTLTSKLKKFLKTQCYDIIMIQSFPPSLLSILAGIDKQKVIVVEHVYAGYYGKLANIIRDRAYSQFAKIVVLTSNDKEFFINRGLGDKTIVIPNPVLPSNEPKSSCEAKRIISVGRLVYQKGYDNLIDIFKVVNKTHPDWKLDIFGDGPLKNQLLQKIKSDGLEDIVNLKGISNNIPSELSLSSIFVLSSHFEGFSMVLVEAMNQGVPCVSFACPNGPSDIVKTGLNGILVADQDMDGMIKALNFMIENPDKRVEYGKNAPNSVKHFSKELIAQMWMTLFNEIYYTNG